QISRTDPDARRLKKHGKSTVGYNVQSVVDDKHKLIVAAEATSAGNDIGQLAPMAEAAKSALGIKEAEIFADAGYWKEEDIAACERAGLLPYVPIPDTERAVRDAGCLPASAFHYLPGPNVHICPGGEVLRPYGEVARNGKTLKRYAARAGRCEGCPLAKLCLPEKTPYRQLYRSELADVVEGHRARMAEHPEAMRARASGALRAPLRHPQALDGLGPLPGPRPGEGPGKTGPFGPLLQLPTSLEHPRARRIPGGL
ncbi:MAG: hypothetical protein EOM91_15675, partial [Sphingobacteriia bacterium]|nr:hypothetical protein [Sphingobacteriia bacterium]